MNGKNQVLSVMLLSLLTSTSLAAETKNEANSALRDLMNDIRLMVIDQFDRDRDGEINERESESVRRSMRDFLHRADRGRGDREREDRLLATLEMLLRQQSVLNSPGLTRHHAAAQTSAAFANTPPEAPHRHSSTAAEGWLRGRAVLLRAFADYLLQRSQAAVLWEHAESLHYDNYLKRGQTAFARKRMVNDYREYKRQRRLARHRRGEQLRRERDEQWARKYALTDFEVNVEKGAIYWPALVAGPRYAEHRTKIETLLNHIICKGYTDDVFYREQLGKACDALRRQLREDYSKDDATTHFTVRQQYWQMYRFLKGVKYVPMNVEATQETVYLASN